MRKEAKYTYRLKIMVTKEMKGYIQELMDKKRWTMGELVRIALENLMKKEGIHDNGRV